jgi:hypothetical protein
MSGFVRGSWSLCILFFADGTAAGGCDCLLHVRRKMTPRRNHYLANYVPDQAPRGRIDAHRLRDLVTWASIAAIADVSPLGGAPDQFGSNGRRLLSSCVRGVNAESTSTRQGARG